MFKRSTPTVADEAHRLIDRSSAAVRDQAVRAQEASVAYIRDEPIRAVLIALAAGAGIALLSSFAARGKPH